MGISNGDTMRKARYFFLDLLSVKIKKGKSKRKITYVYVIHGKWNFQQKCEIWNKQIKVKPQRNSYTIK